MKSHATEKQWAHYIDSSPYWQGLREHRLVLQKCLDTNQFQHYPRPNSLYTGSQNLIWESVSGIGKLVAITKVYTQKSSTGNKYVQAYIDLEEGVRILALILSPTYSQLKIGDQVNLYWPDHKDINGPIFKPINQ